MRLPVDTRELDGPGPARTGATIRILAVALLMLVWPAGLTLLANYSPGPNTPAPYTVALPSSGVIPATDANATPSSKQIWYPPTEGHVKLKLIVPAPDPAATQPPAEPKPETPTTTPAK